MPTIDLYIDELYRRGGEGLSLSSGRPVSVRIRGEEQRLGSDVPTRDRVDELLDEVAPADRWSDDAGSGRIEFRYQAPAGAVTVRAYRTESATRLVCIPTPRSEANETGQPHGDGEPAPDSRESAGARGAAVRGGNGVPDIGTGGVPDGSGRRSAGGTPGVSTAGAADRDRPDEPAAEPDPESGRSVQAPRPGAPAIERLFLEMIAHGCSDLHLSADRVPMFRKDGDIVDLGNHPVIGAEEARELLVAIAPERNREEFEARSDTDFAYEIPHVARFRCNLFRDLNGPGGVFRFIPSEILTAEQIGVPAPVLELCHLHKGLVVVTGPTGSGKSTTLAAMVDHINRERAAHIITVEDPVEFVHPPRRCLINQREVGVHTASFKTALRAALREDPDIVLVGEMRDLETVEIAIETAETGHLVFGTLHTTTASSTVDRIIDQFPSHQQAQIRVMLSESLKGVIAQNLLKKKGGGRVAALEILLVTPAVSNLIREGKTFQIPSLMQTGRKIGMTTLNEELARLVKEGVVEPEEAYSKAVAKSEFKALLERQDIRLQQGRPT